VYDNTTVRLDLDNEPQPDVLLRIDEACGGTSRISDDDYIEGPPELIAEVAHSSAAYDLHDKKQAYRRNGVQEYLVWQIEDERVDWFVLEDSQYASQEPKADGNLTSSVFPGLVLDVDALLAGDLAAVLDLVQRQTDTEAHRAFVDRLG
jgi:Uma2 family endonuclease